MSSTVPPPAKEAEEAFEPDTWDIPELPEASAPGSAARESQRKLPHAPPPALPLERGHVAPGAAPAVAPPSSSAHRQPESTQRAIDPQPGSRVVQPPPLPRQRRSSTGPGQPAPSSSTTSGAASDPRRSAQSTKEWSLLDPGAVAGGRAPSAERPAAPRTDRSQTSAGAVRRPLPSGTTGARAPLPPELEVARPTTSNTERPQGTAVPPPARHAGLEPARPAARPVPGARTLLMPALGAAPSAGDARREPSGAPEETTWDLGEVAPTTVVTVPPLPRPAAAEVKPPEVKAPEMKAPEAPKPPSRPKAAEAPTPTPTALETKAPEAPLPKPPSQEMKAPEPPKPTAPEMKAPEPPTAAKPTAPEPRATVPEAKAPAPEAKPTAPEAKAHRTPAPRPAVEAPRAPAPTEAKTVEPPRFEPRATQPPAEDLGWLAPIIEPGTSLDDIERREASVLLDFDSALLPSPTEREHAAPGQESGDSICTFWLGEDCFGLDVQLVSEVLLIDDIHPVPWAPPALLGLFNSRGRIVPVVELGSLLGLDSAGAAARRAPRHAAPAILIKADSLVAAAVIDRPGLVVRIHRNAVTPTERGSAEPWVKGHLRLDERSQPAVTLLDPESLVQRFLDVSRFPDIRTCLGGGGYRPARATSAKNSEGNIA